MSNKFQNPNLIIKNGAFLMFRMLLVLFLGFFATRLTLQVLGDEKFGIYNIVGGIIAIFAIISMPIRDSLQRFFNVELAKNNLSPSTVFSTSSRIVRLMVLVITVLYETVGLYLINFVIKYPPEEHFAVNVIFQICALANVFGFAELPYVSLLFSRENMGIPAICEIVKSVVKILLLYIIIYIPTDVLISYSSIFLFLNISVFFYYRFYCRRKYPECFKDTSANTELQKNMLSFSGWSFIEAVSGIAITYVSNIFINIFGGVLYNTAYGITKQLQNAVIHFSSNVLKAADPQITSGTATDNIKYRDQLVMTTVKVCFLFTSFVYVVFHFEGELLLRFWLGKIPLYVMEFCEVMFLTLIFTSISLPFRTIIMATGRVKWFFTTYGIESFIIMGLMYIFLKKGYPVIIVMYLILLSAIIMLIITVYFAKRESGISVYYVVKNFLPAVMVVVISWAVYYFVNLLFLTDIAGFIIPTLGSFLTLLCMSYLMVLTSAEKRKIANIWNKIISKLNKS